MSNATVRGKVHVIDETKTFGKNGFRKRMVVLENDEGRFTAYIPIDFVQDACDTVDDLKVGQEVEITYRLGGRKWQRDPQSEVKYFLSAEAQSFRVLDGGTSATDDDLDDVNAQLNAAAQEQDDVPF